MPIINSDDQQHLALHLERLRQLPRVLLETPAVPFPATAAIDSACPQEIAQWAYWGESLYPATLDDFIKSTKSGGSHEKTAKSRIGACRREVARLNNTLMMRGQRPISEDVAPNAGQLGKAIPTGMANYAVMLIDQIKADRTFLASKQSNQRLDLLAKDLGFKGYGAYKSFCSELEKVCAEMGFGSYRNLCKGSAYISHLREARPELSGILNSEEWKTGEAVFRQRSPYLIDRIIECRKSPRDCDFWIEPQGGHLYCVFRDGEVFGWDIILGTFERGYEPAMPGHEQARVMAAKILSEIFAEAGTPPDAD
ncbi:hypothetical protein [Caballeronia sp. dw_19]|uniref:hypothetical protein n=1 Tax=Caballeronia sp. dw_19 TaxID=2719791 RepID=UPI001BD0E9F9|nr:hypothetical protein [Caballeronia sp. dw_19]